LIPEKPPILVGCFYFHADAKNPYKNAYKEKNITPRDIFSSFPEENYPPQNQARDRCKKSGYGERIHLEQSYVLN